jgi:hypothetical protein
MVKFIKILLLTGLGVMLFTAVNTPVAHAAKLYFYPQSVSVIEGDTYTLEVRLDTEGESINALDVTGKVDGGTIESVGTANSFIQIFIKSEKTGDNTFHFAGGTPGGFTGNGVVGLLTVRADSTGEGRASFDDSSNLLSGTGESLGQDTEFSETSVNTSAKDERYIKITSRSHPDQNKWYSNTKLNLHWDLEDGVQYSYVISNDPTKVPDDIPDKPSGTLEWLGDVSIEGLDQGVYYFALKRVGESSVYRYRVMIDTTPPEWAGVEVSKGVPETDNNDFVVFLAKDSLSGVDHYEVRVDDGPSKTVESPYVLPKSYGKVTITAFDKAGNRADKVIYGKGEKNVAIFYIIIALIVIGGAVAFIKPLREKMSGNES